MSWMMFPSEEFPAVFRRCQMVLSSSLLDKLMIIRETVLCYGDVMNSMRLFVSVTCDEDGVRTFSLSAVGVATPRRRLQTIQIRALLEKIVLIPKYKSVRALFSSGGHNIFTVLYHVGQQQQMRLPSRRPIQRILPLFLGAIRRHVVFLRSLSLQKE